MELGKAIVVGAVIIGICNVMAEGFFVVIPINSVGNLARYNKITGTIEHCEINDGCRRPLQAQ